MKITFLSDTHTLHNNVKVAPCDIFCFSGDATNIGELVDFVSFFEWLRSIPAKHIVWIAGNHDKSLDKELMGSKSNDAIIRMLGLQKYEDVTRLIKDLPPHIHYLQNSGVTIEGINFWGSPNTPAFGVGWAFNKLRGDSINAVWNRIPKDTNILLTHTPPYKILDYVEERLKRYPNEDQHTGCVQLMERIKFSLPKLKVHAFGHIHHNTGMVVRPVSNARNCLFINACLLNNRYDFIHNEPISINYELL